MDGINQGTNDMKEQLIELVHALDLRIRAVYPGRPFYNENTHTTWVFKNDNAECFITYDDITYDLHDISINSIKNSNRYQYRKNEKADIDNDAIQLDVYLDILEKATAIWRDEPFDTRVMMELDLDEETIELMNKMASDRGITVDELVEQALMAVMAREDDLR